MVIVNERELAVDISEELAPYMDRFHKIRVRGVKLQSCSPFREEKSPSFAVNLENGLWVDSGAISDKFYKGNFISLLAFLREESYADTVDYLLSIYDAMTAEASELKLSFDLNKDDELMKPDYSNYFSKDIEYRSPYLERRGIKHSPVIEELRVHDTAEEVVIPWFDKSGEVINLKHRTIKSKFFWYDAKGLPIKQHIYGFNLYVNNKDVKELVCTESETDALYLIAHGIPAIAFGGASLSNKQLDILHNSHIEKLVLAFDNDDAGIRFTRQFIRRTLDRYVLYTLTYPKGVKDVNDMSIETVRKVLANRTPVPVVSL